MTTTITPQADSAAFIPAYPEIGQASHVLDQTAQILSVHFWRAKHGKGEGGELPTENTLQASVERLEWVIGVLTGPASEPMPSLPDLMDATTRQYLLKARWS